MKLTDSVLLSTKHTASRDGGSTRDMCMEFAGKCKYPQPYILYLQNEESVATTLSQTGDKSKV